MNPHPRIWPVIRWHLHQTLANAAIGDWGRAKRHATYLRRAIELARIIRRNRARTS